MPRRRRRWPRIAADDGRGRASRRATRSSSPPRPERLDGRRSSSHDAKALRVDAARRHDARRLPDRARPGVPEPRRPRGRVRRRGQPRAGGRTRRRPRSSGTQLRRLRLRDPLLEPASASAAPSTLYRDVELPLTARARRDGGRRRPASTRYRMGEITARLADRVEELESKRVRARGRGVHARLDAAGRAASCSRSSSSPPAARARPATRPTRSVLRSIRGEHEIVGVIEEWRELLKLAQHVPRAAAVADRRRTAACTRRSTRPSPRPAGSRRRTRTSRRSRSAPSSAARSARRSSPSRATG